MAKPASIRASLHAALPEPETEATLVEKILKRTGVDITLCPRCGKGHLKRTLRTFPPERAPP